MKPIVLNWKCNIHRPRPETRARKSALLRMRADGCLRYDSNLGNVVPARVSVELIQFGSIAGLDIPSRVYPTWCPLYTCPTSAGPSSGAIHLLTKKNRPAGQARG